MLNPRLEITLTSKKLCKTIDGYVMNIQRKLICLSAQIILEEKNCLLCLWSREKKPDQTLFFDTHIIVIHITEEIKPLQTSETK